MARISLIVIVALLLAGPLFCPFDPIAQDREAASSPPTIHHWLGTDDYGRDLAARFLYGGRWSILTGAAATLLALTLGWIAGGAAGFIGGAADAIIMMVAEWFLAVPWLYLLVAARAAMPLDLSPRVAMLAIILLIAIVNWARPARLVRGLVLTLSRKGYVEAARGFGVPRWKIFVRHILPGTAGLLTAQALLLFPRFVLAEVTLSFLGLGAGEPHPSWGALILPLKQIYLLSDHWWTLLPTLLMLPFFVATAILAQGLEKRYRLSR
ncbi:MAG: ABC transporter permease [Acidobacteriia bacterium]|nr:ABC transporter permease [Terriglobia bacterium]